MICDNESNFPRQLLFTNILYPHLRKAFANHSSTDIKLSKAQEDFLVDYLVHY